MKAKEIASFLNTETIGNPMKEVTKPGYLHTAKPNELAYCFLKNDEKDLEAISNTNAGIVICQKHLEDKLASMKVKPTLILSETPKYDFAKVLQQFFAKEKPTVSPRSYVGKNVRLGENVDIHPGAVIYDGK